jgi:hypothetical protein
VGASQLSSTLISQGYQQAILNEYVLQSPPNVYEVKFYPNPFSTQLTFELPLDYDNLQITIIDLRGRSVLTEMLTTANQLIVLKLPSLSDSEYIITLTALDFYFQTKIIKKL